MTDPTDEPQSESNPVPDPPAPQMPADVLRVSLAGGEESVIDAGTVEGLFLQALQQPSGPERKQWLNARTGDDPQLKQRVVALLAAWDDAGSFLETPAMGAGLSESESLSFLTPSDEDGILGTLAHYRVLEVIGRGGMGVVLKALDPSLNRVVAVKVLLPHLAANPNARRRFVREAQAAAAISHPHVVTLHAVGELPADGQQAGGLPWLVMEYVAGRSLQEKLSEEGWLEVPEILRISRQIADGLSAAHRQGLIHRDIKPANILLENGVERVRISDFGLARAVDDITVTRTGEVTGTPEYMSPEQATGGRIDHRSDLFSLGCVMYALCTGHSPFRGDSLAHVVQRVTQESPRSLEEQRPELPGWLIRIVECLLHRSPDQRLKSAEELVSLLDQHAAPSGSDSEFRRPVPPVAGSPAPVISRAVSRVANLRLSEGLVAAAWTIMSVLLACLTSFWVMGDVLAVTQSSVMSAGDRLVTWAWVAGTGLAGCGLVLGRIRRGRRYGPSFLMSAAMLIVFVHTLYRGNAVRWAAAGRWSSGSTIVIAAGLFVFCLHSWQKARRSQAEDDSGRSTCEPWQVPVGRWTVSGGFLLMVFCLFPLGEWPRFLCAAAAAGIVGVGYLLKRMGESASGELWPWDPLRTLPAVLLLLVMALLAGRAWDDPRQVRPVFRGPQSAPVMAESVRPVVKSFVEIAQLDEGLQLWLVPVENRGFSSPQGFGFSETRPTPGKVVPWTEPEVFELTPGTYQVMVGDVLCGWLSDAIRQQIPSASADRFRYGRFYEGERIQLENGQSRILRVSRDIHDLADETPVADADGVFRFIWGDRTYELTQLQAHVVHLLLDREQSSLSLPQTTKSEKQILQQLSVAEMESPPQTLRQIFDDGDHPAWGQLIRFENTDAGRVVWLSPLPTSEEKDQNRDIGGDFDLQG